VALVSDSYEPVRNASAEALGTLMKIIGERGLNAYLEGMDDLRKARVKEYFETAQVKAKATKPPPASAAAAKPTPKARPGTRVPAVRLAGNKIFRALTCT